MNVKYSNLKTFIPRSERANPIQYEMLTKHFFLVIYGKLFVVCMYNCILFFFNFTFFFFFEKYFYEH